MHPVPLPALVALAPLLLLLGCSTTEPYIDTEAPPEATWDGLYPVQNTRMDRVWARPDFDLSGYRKLMIQSAGVQYRQVPEAPAGSAGRMRSSATAFPMDAQQRADFEALAREVFSQALQQVEGFEFATAPGPDVLLVRAGLGDVVSRVPPDTPLRTDMVVLTVGEATLLVELVDSETGTVLVRGVDRRAARQQGVAMRSTPVTNRAEVRRMLQLWAQQLRTGLEELAERMRI